MFNLLRPLIGWFRLPATTQQGIQQIMATLEQFQTELAGVRADVAAQTSVINSTKVAFTGLAAQLAAAIADAKDKGVPDDALAGLTALHADLKTNTDLLASATVQNTPSTNEPAAPVVPGQTVDTSNIGTTPQTQDGQSAGVQGGTEGSAEVQE